MPRRKRQPGSTACRTLCNTLAGFWVGLESAQAPAVQEDLQLALDRQGARLRSEVEVADMRGGEAPSRRVAEPEWQGDRQPARGGPPEFARCPLAPGAIGREGAVPGGRAL